MTPALIGEYGEMRLFLIEDEGVRLEMPSWRTDLGEVTLTLEEADWLFRYAGPSVLIALNAAEKPSRG